MFTLAGVRACRCGPFGSGLAVSLVNAPRAEYPFKKKKKLSPFLLYSEVFGGFSSSIVAPPLISAQQKKRAIRAIIVAAACFLAVQRLLRLLSGSAVRGLERGEEQGRQWWGERRNGYGSLQCLQEKEKNITWEAGVFLQCRHSRDSRPPACGPWEQWTCHLPTWSVMKLSSPRFHWLLSCMKSCGLRTAWAKGNRFANKKMLFEESRLAESVHRICSVQYSDPECNLVKG